MLPRRYRHITNHIRRAIVRFEFDITWRVRQLPEARGCAARWELSRGPEFLRDNRGWLRVSELDTRLAMLELQHELNAPRVTPDKAAAYVSLLHERLAGLTTP